MKDTGRGVTLSRLGYETLTRPKSYHLRHTIDAAGARGGRRRELAPAAAATRSDPGTGFRSRGSATLRGGARLVS